MEMVIATAILAGSGAALFALVGQASRLARKAEERTVALQLAQSTLDEFLANGGDAEQEAEGGFESDPRWSYRIEQSQVEASGSPDRPLNKITVSILRAAGGERTTTAAADAAVVRLVRWSRSSEPTDPLSTDPLSAGTASAADSAPAAPANPVSASPGSETSRLP